MTTTQKEQAASGQPTTAPLGPQIPKRLEWVDVDAEHYPDFKLRVWVNMPHELWRDLYSGDTDALHRALGQIVPEHNGWRDYEGKPMPPSTSAEFWELLPVELFRLAIASIEHGMHRLPNSRLATRTP